MSFIKNVAVAVAGATVGTLAGVAMIPAYWAVDTIAPVSYPLCAAAATASFSKALAPEKRVSKALVLAIGAAGVFTVPFAPLNALTRPVVVPFSFAAMGIANALTFYNK